MNKSKYYTPEESEISVGLYCIYTTLDCSFSESSYLRPENKDEDDLIDCEKDGLESSDISLLIQLYYTMQDVCQQIRVKYLDREDIESLGFTFFGENNENLVNSSVNMYHNDELNLMLGHYYNLGQIVIATKDPSKNEIFSKTGQDPNRTGFLKIKNKTELIKLLKQLDI